MKWLHTFRNYPCNSDAFFRAAEQGHLDVLAWIHENQPGSIGCTWPVFNAAAGAGHLHVLKWLHDHGIEGNEGALYDAVAGNHLEAVQWLCTKDILDFYESDYALYIAEEYNHVAIIDFLNTQ
jgi:hypothetical protein